MRDLWRRDQDRGLSAGEKRMLSKARQVLVGELSLAEGVDDEKTAEIFSRIEATIERHQSLADEAANSAEPKAAAGDDAVDLDAED